MSDNRLEDLIAAYAIGNLDADETAEVEAAIASDPDAAASFDEYLETAAELGAGLETDLNQVALWNRIAADTKPADVVPLRRSPRILAAVSIAAVSLTAVLGITLFLQRSDTPPLTAAVEETRREPGTVVVAMTGDVSAEVVLGDDGIGYLVPTDLPPLSSESTYQLWAIVDERVISAGVFGKNPGIAPFQIDADVPVTGFALTVEIAGGVVSSQNEAVSLGLLDA